MLPMSENGIFWNVYEQECRFKGIIKKPPRFVRTTCDKLAALYPDLDDAEMFMRAQFTTVIEDLDYSFDDVVFAFKDFIMDRHRRAYSEYNRWHLDEVKMKIEMAFDEISELKSHKITFYRLLKEANVSLSDWQSRGMEALEHLPEEQQWNICEFSPSPAESPLVRYLVDKKNCSQEDLEHVVIKCLHYPLFMKYLPLTDHVKERIQFYKDEVRMIEKPRRYSGNSKYLIDLPDL